MFGKLDFGVLTCPRCRSGFRRSFEPRVRDGNAPFRHYVDPRAVRQPATCMARHCRRRLRRDQSGVCSKACADAVFNHALYLLRMSEATPDEVLQYYKGPVRPPVEDVPDPRQPPSAARLKAARDYVKRSQS